MMGLSGDDMYRICVCVQEYLCGNLDVGSDNTMRPILDGDRYINTDLIDFASGRYTTEEKKKFLCNGQGYRGDNVVKLVCCHLLPKFIESIDEEMEVNNKQILRLKRKIKKLRKGEDNEESGSDEDDVDGEEGDEQSSNDEGNIDTDGEEDIAGND